MSMKKMFFVAAGLLLLGAGCFGQQVREIYAIEEFGFQLSFPESFDVVTADVGDVVGLEPGAFSYDLDLWIRGPQTEEYGHVGPVIRLQVSPVELEVATRYEYQVSMRPDGKLILGESFIANDEIMSDNMSFLLHEEDGFYYLLSVSAANKEIADMVLRDISAHFEVLPTGEAATLEANLSE